MESSVGNIFLWNGEVFDGITVRQHENDTSIVFNLLNEAIEDAEILNIMEKVEGCFAFLFYQKRFGKIWFGRDLFGRRSLLIRNKNNQVIDICSVATSFDKWTEVSARSIFLIDLKNLYTDQFIKEIQRNYTEFALNEQIIDDISNITPLIHSTTSTLLDSVRKRVQNIPDVALGRSKLAILFSGGLDSTVLARLVDIVLPETEIVDLINVAFENDRFIKNKKKCCDIFDVPDRLSGRRALENLR